MGVLNSKVFAYYYASVSTLMRGGYFRFFSQYVEAAPIPIPSERERAELKALVTRRLALEQEGSSDEAPGLEEEIDRMVFGLYGLTEEEIGIVEGSGKGNAAPVKEGG